MISEQEQERFMRLWTDAQPAVVNYLHAMVRDPAMAKDLVRETAMVLFRRFGDYDALTLSAWVRVKGLDREFNSLFMCDGFAPGTIHWLIRNDGVLGLTVFGQGSGDFQILASPPVLTLDKFGMWLHLAVVLDGQARQIVQYVNGAPVSRHALKLEPPFRLGPCELGNWNARSDPNPAPLLIRNFSGSLDEFALFNRALTDAQVRELYTTGKPDE